MTKTSQILIHKFTQSPERGFLSPLKVYTCERIQSYPRTQKQLTKVLEGKWFNDGENITGVRL